MSDLDLAALRATAEAVDFHAGPWRTTPGYAGHTCIRADVVMPADEFGPGGEADLFVVDCDTSATASHIAAFDPPTAIALLDRLEAAEAEHAALWHVYGGGGGPERIAKAFSGHDDLEWKRLDPRDRQWLLAKAQRVTALGRSSEAD